MMFVSNLVFLVFCDLLRMISVLFMSSASSCHFVRSVLLLLIFMFFFLFVSCLAFYILGLGNLFGKEES